MPVLHDVLCVIALLSGLERVACAIVANPEASVHSPRAYLNTERTAVHRSKHRRLEKVSRIPKKKKVPRLQLFQCFQSAIPCTEVYRDTGAFLSQDHTDVTGHG
jgi:hypothetical protein